jgi:cell division septation protein DedD
MGGSDGMRKYLVLALPVLLSACALPPGLVIASYGADGLSYLSTGKSLEDHGMSYALNEDCALHRVLTRKPICKDNPVAPAVIAVEPLQPLPPSTAPAASTDLASSRHESLQTAAVFFPREPATAKTGQGRYLVLGSFETRENAVRFALGFGESGIAVSAAAVNGRMVYRVVAGPLTMAKVVNLRARLADKGAEAPWEVAGLPPGVD